MWKRVGLFSRKRQLILTDRPRLFYIDASRMVKKGEIPWSKDISVTVKEGTRFDISVPGRNYHLTDILGDASRWKIAIREQLEIWMAKQGEGDDEEVVSISTVS